MSDGSTNASLFDRIDDVSLDMQYHASSYLDAASAHQEIQRVRTTAFEFFAPAEGERLLDAGCGAGEVARQLATRVGSTGSVVAVDQSEHMLAIARSRHDGGPVTYALGDVTSLDFPTGHFDGVRCERVLQHVANSDAAIRELIRVTRPGGRICVIDTDWTTHVWDGFDQMEEVARSFLRNVPDPAAGRTTRARLVRAGAREVSALPVTLRFTSPADAAVIVPFFVRDLMRAFLPKDLYDRFYASVDESAERGDFLFAFTMWICQGRIPVDGRS
jgi:ubiquinone/menaquinone biosynthesis C-methylase UbiE